ncbi:hypothetical protein BS50DRAFT_682518 [Corynespora cassiicola Philippines]|uniref:Uncharacterized protein n=1 Tax=Corynespora cassiicola Philippines TaxID=1448308 RepID=A0A2T2N0U0_CORCC|nr:hypothetical protein BS50DRAFT_682518 [Corynespora cassiicola Philippines]
METLPYDNWYLDQPFESIDQLVNPGADDQHLPPIAETDLELGLDWDRVYDPSPQPNNTVDQTPSGAGVEEPRISQELTNLREQLSALRQAFTEMSENICRKLDDIEKSVAGTQRYVNSLYPWSMEVHESYSKVIELMEQREQERDKMAFPSNCQAK